MKASTVIQRVQDNTRKYESTFRASDRALTQATSDELKLEQQILDQLSKIAAIQLGDSNLLNHEVRTTLATRQNAIVHLQENLARVEAEIGQTISTHQALKNKSDDIEGEMLKALGADKAFRAAVNAREDAQLAVTLGTPSYAEIKAEVEHKLPAFRSSKLFLYLERQRFGTQEYAGGKVSLFLDRWVAGRINYLRNKSNYDTLLALATANQQQMDDLISEVQAREAEVAKQRQDAAERFKLVDLEKEIETKEQLMADLKEKANSIHQQLDQFSAKTDVYHRKAHDLMIGALQQKSISELVELCRKTENPADDAYAISARNLYEELRKVRDAIPKLREEREAQSRQYERAKDIERKLKTSRYNSSKYRYTDSLDLDSLLIGYMAGSLSSSSVTSKVESSASRIPDEDTFGGGGFSSGSSSFGGGGFSSSSSFGGGGFSTSDSF